jgi:hypothetical protein
VSVTLALLSSVLRIYQMKQTGSIKPRVLALLLAPLIASCQTRMTVTPPTEPLVCSQWLPLGYGSRHDSPQTVNDIRRANAKRNAYCE